MNERQAMSHDHYRKLERMYGSARTNEYYRPTMLVSEGHAEVVIELRPDFHHALDAVHGSVYFKALDDAAFFASNSLIDDVFVLTVSFNVYFTRPVTEGVITAVGNVVHRSRRLLIAESVLTDQEGRDLARGSGTFMKSRVKLTPEIGYALD